MNNIQIYKHALSILDEINEELLNGVNKDYYLLITNGFINAVSKELLNESSLSDEQKKEYVTRYKSDLSKMTADQKLELFVTDSSIVSLTRINNYINYKKKLSIFECYSICKLQTYLCKTVNPSYKYSLEKLIIHNFNALKKSNPFSLHIIRYHRHKLMKQFDIGQKYHCGHYPKSNNSKLFSLIVLPISYLSFLFCRLLLK